MSPLKKDIVFFVIVSKRERAKDTFVIFITFNIFHSPRSPKLFHNFEMAISCITKKNEAEKKEVIELTHECIKILRIVIEPDGFNTGYNIG